MWIHTHTMYGHVHIHPNIWKPPQSMFSFLYADLHVCICALAHMYMPRYVCPCICASTCLHSSYIRASVPWYVRVYRRKIIFACRCTRAYTILMGMHMCVPTCVHLYMCLHARLCWTRTWVCSYSCVSVHMCAHASVCMRMHAHVHLWSRHAHLYVLVCRHTFMCLCTWPISVYKHVCRRTCVHALVYKYIRTRPCA